MCVGKLHSYLRSKPRFQATQFSKDLRSLEFENMCVRFNRSRGDEASFKIQVESSTAETAYTEVRHDVETLCTIFI